jgi:hypothetical protein
MIFLNPMGAVAESGSAVGLSENSRKTLRL